MVSGQVLHIAPSTLQGTIAIPSSKSHSLRALVFAMMGHGTSHIMRLLCATDTERMLTAIELFGAKIFHFPTHIEVSGGFAPYLGIVEAGQSGLVLRLIGALSGLLSSTTRLRGDPLRLITPLLQGLTQLGATISKQNDLILISGPLHPGIATLSGLDSQPVSGLLIATSFLQGHSELIVEEPREEPWIDLTLNWLRMLGATIIHEDYAHYWIEGGLSYEGFTYTVPGDFSSAAFPLVASLITGSSLTLTGLDFDDVQGDKMVFDWVQEMGALLIIDKEKKQVNIPGNQKLRGITVNLNLCIDALPILAVLGCFTEGEMNLIGAGGARFKESNRIAAICQELKKMGANIEELPDGLRVKSSPLQGAELHSHLDHRIAMSLAIAALGATGSSRLLESNYIEKTYPTFVQDFQQIGASYRQGVFFYP